MNPELLARQFAERHPLPDWYTGIMERAAINHDRAPRLETLVSASQDLSARLLALVNSSFYGFPSPLATLPLASTVLGRQAILDLLRALAAAQALNGLRPETLDIGVFWQHAVVTGLLARHLGRLRGLRSTETLFLAGLLHDVGKLVIHEQLPEQAVALRRQYDDGKGREFELEHALLGYNHTATGAALLEIWSMPDILASAARDHHRQAESDPYPMTVAAVADANRNIHDKATDRPVHAAMPVPAEDPAWLELELQAVELEELLFPGI
ncbi:MAG: HDOD domain-containing protein [Aquisalimonadaceae bacterium]